MKNSRLDYRNWLAFAIGIAIVVTLGTSALRTTNSASAAVTTTDVDLASEARIIDRYGDDLYTYQKECSQLKKRASLLQADIDPVARKSDDLKRRLSEVQNAIRTVVAKLKAANQWDSLNPNDFFRQALEEGASNLSSYTNEIGLPVENLRKKVTAQTFQDGGRTTMPIVLAAYRVPAPMKFVSVSCTIQTVRVGLIRRLNDREVSVKACVAHVCACGGNNPATAGTGTANTSLCSTSTQAASDCPQN